MSLLRIPGAKFSTLFTNKSPITPALRHLTAKMAALLRFRKAGDFLRKLVPLSARAIHASNESCNELVVGFDGDTSEIDTNDPERNFEIIAGKALDSDGHACEVASLEWPHRAGNRELGASWTMGAGQVFRPHTDP